TLVTEVMETIESEAIDIVVMGTRGATGAKEILFGTNTVHVIKKAKCPVIAVPPNYQYVPPRVILFPTDYEINFQKKELEPLLTLVDQHRTKVNVMHVSTGYDLTPNQKEHKKGLKKLLGSHGFFHDLPNNNIIDAINGFQVEEKINLLVMVQNKHTFLERLFIEPVIKKIGFHILTPFMVIPQL
ncbi:MAG TPA: universal stress protein, partial [Pricia sp.]|nr:universal stress protein [Pricia sp.]